MTRGSTRLAGLLAAPLLIASIFSAGAQTLPTITRARFEQRPNGLILKIIGTNFGNSPVALPCNYCNIPELIWAQFPQNIEPVTITRWTNTEIILHGINATAGATFLFSVKNDSLNATVVGAANVPGGAAPPVIRKLEFARTGQDMKIVVLGRGFGEKPRDIPGDTDIPYFVFATWVNGGSGGNYPWYAGYGEYKKVDKGDGVTLKYVSWTDSRIEIHGFGARYGQQGWTVASGDAVAVAFYSNPGGGILGPSAGKASRIP
jgi:hypothetical protein